MSKESENNSTSLKATLIIALIKVLAAMPLALSKLCLRPFAWLQWLIPNESVRVAKLNLNYCLPNKSEAQISAISRELIKHNMNLIAETTHIWRHDYTVNKRMLKHLHGLEELKTAMQSESGTLLFSPHIGNWELTYAFLANEFNSSGIYKPPNIPELEDMMLAGRRGGGKIFRTQARDIRNMLKELKQGGSLFLLPDQQPPKGSGVFASFFNQPAYTMTLIQGLLQRTGSDFWLCYSVFEKDGYVIYAKKVAIDGSLPAEEFAEALNCTMEDVIQQSPEQYQWTYKRFKRTPDGSPSIYNR
ncbi:MAG: lysophospholipid acyltransferase family protein [Enterobacterales bacterium]|nr:lysophospholipid acyltransferase family protein [Enterobacterales bacterium]